jgi:hypothetical protein
MAIKGINPFEQHIEKIVVAIAAAAFLGVLSMQFLGKPNSVKIGTSKDDVPIDKAYDVVEKKAREVEGKITSVDPAVVVPPGTKGVLEDFRSKQKGSVAPHPQLAAALDRPRAIIGGVLANGKPGEVQNARYASFTPGAPAKPIAATYIATIHPLEVQQAPELAKLLPPPPAPPDKASISVESTFNGKGLADLLTADPDGDGPASALPSHWWQGGVQILGVGLERQELNPDGTWTQGSPVPPMPGRFDMKAEIEKNIAAGGSLKSGLDDAAKLAPKIRRQPYYAVLFGEEWVPPSEATAQYAAGGAGDAKAQLHHERDQKNREIQQRQAERKALDSGDERPPPPPKSPGGPSGKSGGPGRETPPPGGSDRKTDEKSKRIKTLDTRIEKLFDDRAKIDAKLAELGEKLPDAAPGAGPAVKTAATAAEPALLDSDSIRIWSHDVTVERGKTYRYRIHVFINNPIYGHIAGLLPEQADLAKPLALRSADSEWSDAVTVDDQSYYFITSAQEQDPVTKGPKAAAEVYVFNWGYWRKGSVTLDPGDALTVDVKLPDFDKALAAAAKPRADPDHPADVIPPPRQPEGPGGGGGGKNVRPPTPGVPPPPEEPIDPTVPRPAEPVTFKQVKIENDALLLDVANTAAIGEEGLRSQKAEPQAYLRDTAGRIVTRIPEQDRKKDIYMRVSRSATLGEEATQPKTAIIEPNHPVKPPEPKKKEGDKAPAPSSGGG